MSYFTDTFWIGNDPHPGLAIVLRPRGNDWLEDELQRMKSRGVSTLVSLLEASEAEELGLAQEAELAQRSGLVFLTYPIPDRQLPNETTAFHRFVSQLAQRMSSGERIGIHCRASIGRSTMLAACVLIHLGWAPEIALEKIEAVRGCPVPDTAEQRNWILHYRAEI